MSALPVDGPLVDSECLELPFRAFLAGPLARARRGLRFPGGDLAGADGRRGQTRHEMTGTETRMCSQRRGIDADGGDDEMSARSHEMT